jgi:hypothetical protein
LQISAEFPGKNEQPTHVPVEFHLIKKPSKEPVLAGRVTVEADPAASMFLMVAGEELI